MSLQGSGLEQLKRMALTGQKHIDALVGYYRTEIDRYNDERAQWALHYQILKSNASNRYTLNQELDCSRSHINHLQANLNTTKANLNQQRQRYFEMLENNQQVKDKLQDNRKRYRELIAVCKPISVNKINGRNSRSKINTPSVIRGEMELELIQVGRQHDHRKAKMQEKIQALKEELDGLVSEHSQRGRNCSQQYKSVLENLAEWEDKIMTLTSQYFKLRMGGYEQQRKVQEQNEILRLKAVALAKKLQILKDSHSQQFKTVEKEVKIRNKDFRQKYDEQLKKKEEHLSLVKEQNQKINQIYILKLKRLESQLKEIMQKQKNADSKMKSQTSSLRNQIKILKGRNEFQGIRQMRAQMAEEEEEDSSGSLSMSELENLNRQVDALKKKI